MYFIIMCYVTLYFTCYFRCFQSICSNTVVISNMFCSWFITCYIKFYLTNYICLSISHIEVLWKYIPPVSSYTYIIYHITCYIGHNPVWGVATCTGLDLLHTGVMTAIAEPLSKSHKSAWPLIFLELSKILENHGPLWRGFKPARLHMLQNSEFRCSC